MVELRRDSPTVRTLIAMAALVVVVAGMRASEPILVPFLISAFLAVICTPPLNWLHGKGIPKFLAVPIVIVASVAAGLFVFALIGSSVNDFLGKRSEYRDQLIAQKESAVKWLKQNDVDVSEALHQLGIEPEGLVFLFGNLLGSLGNMFGNASLIVLTLIFILLEAFEFPSKLAAMPGSVDDRTDRMDRILANIRHYVAIKTWLSLLTGVLIAVWLKWLGVDYPYLWGMVAFLFNFIPNIGSIIAAVPAVLLAMLQSGQSEFGSALPLYTGLGYVVVNCVVGYGLEPRVMGRGLGLSTLVVFLSLVFWGWVLGPVGMVLSVPLTMIVKIYLDSSEETRWIAILLSADAPAVKTANVAERTAPT